MATCPVCGAKLPKIRERRGKITVIRYGPCPNCSKKKEKKAEAKAG